MHNKPRQLPVFFSSFSGGHREWQPAADIYRTRAGWLLKLDVAGVRLEDIKTEITASEVRIQGCRRDFQAVEGCRHYSMEISYNRFQRCISLPCDLTGAEVRLDCSNGILLVELITEGKSS
jgi:HSP20 family protein